MVEFEGSCTRHYKVESGRHSFPTLCIVLFLVISFSLLYANGVQLLYLLIVTNFLIKNDGSVRGKQRVMDSRR